MRAKLALIPLAAGLALLGACASKDPAPSSSTPAPAVTTPAGNGVADLEAKAIMEKAQQALAAQKSYRFSGELSEEGQKVKMDVTIAGDDKKLSADFGIFAFDL